MYVNMSDDEKNYKQKSQKLNDKKQTLEFFINSLPKKNKEIEFKKKQIADWSDLVDKKRA